MTSDAQPSLLNEWCDLTSSGTGNVGPDLYAEANFAWESTRSNIPTSLLHALAKDEERQLAKMIDQQVAYSDLAVPSPLLTRLHKTFVTEFDPIRELDHCKSIVSTIMSIKTSKDLGDVLADLTRSGYGSPLHLASIPVLNTKAFVVPAIHPAPLPPADFSDRDRLPLYLQHMASMVRHIGGFISEEQLAGVVALDQALWTDLITREPQIEFPWRPFLERAVGARTKPWTGRIGLETQRRMAAWWAGTLQQKRDWILCRIAYDLGPFTSEEALVQNSQFFAGRVLGIIHPRSRPDRFVSFVKTVAPHILAELYVRDRRDDALLDRARLIVADLRREATAWTEATSSHETGARDDTQRLRDLVVELGHQEPGASLPPENADAGVSVCNFIRIARAFDVDRQHMAIDDPACAEDWKIQPYTAAAYYQASSNKVVVPWALMREPMLGANLATVQVYALFGALVAHEMAHAVLPTAAADWPGFVERASLQHVLARFADANDVVGEFRAKASHDREMAADAIGFLWCYRAFSSRYMSENNTDRPPESQFLRYWATRWRGTRPDGRSFAHIDHHPPPEQRCNIAPTYANNASMIYSGKYQEGMSNELGT